MADLVVGQAPAYSCGFWCIIGQIFLYMIGMFIPLGGIQALVMGLIIAIQGSLDGDKPSRENRIFGTVIAVIGWIVVPVTSALFETLAKSKYDSMLWDRYPEYFVWITKGWVIFTLDVISVVAAAFLIHKGSSRIKQYFADQLQDDHSSRNPLLCISPGKLALIFEIVSSTALSWTALNILVYAAKYGIFERHGNVRDFFYCYLYTISLVLAWVLWTAAMMAGPLGLIACIILAGCCIYMVFNIHYGKHTTWSKPEWKEVKMPALWCFLSAFTGVALTFPSFFIANCMGDENRLKTAIKEMYESGAASNATLNWTVVANFTGNYNVSTGPYRPPPPMEYGVGPLDVEFHCWIVGGVAVFALAWCCCFARRPVWIVVVLVETEGICGGEGI
ncbi:hypothetical protein MRB53_040996 [Persea americana]|nr:hypothetical protein MRB53_040996 [Persea americana]